MSESNVTQRDDELREKYPVVTNPTRDQLTDKQLVDYEDFRLAFLYWLETAGKAPEHLGDSGFAEGVVKNTAYRTDLWLRWVWEEEEGYTLNIDHEHADDYLQYLAFERSVTTAHGRAVESALKRYFKWIHWERGGELWEPVRGFPSQSSVTKPADFLTKDERGKIRDAALDYSSVPAYNDLSPEQRDRWKTHLAKKLRKKKKNIRPLDFERRRGWKIASLVGVSLDAGLRPSEVEVAHTGWLDLDNDRLLIPREDSRKNQNNWEVPLRSRTSKWLAEWVKERENYPEYDDTDLLWLPRENNPYSSQSLRSLIRRLCDKAGIDYENRKMSWYSLRHSVGTHMVSERDLKSAQEQLRHNSPRTTMQYDGAPADERRDALDRMG